MVIEVRLPLGDGDIAGCWPELGMASMKCKFSLGKGLSWPIRALSGVEPS